MIISSSSSFDEESLVDLLSRILLIEDNGGDEENDGNEIEINGLEDLIPYIYQDLYQHNCKKYQQTLER